MFEPRTPRGVVLAAALTLTTTAAVHAGITVCDSSGPDVIVGEIDGISNYTSVGGIEAFSIGTVSCNIGSEVLNWISQTDQHPVIGQNMYRLKDGRFEQIGQSWLKHGFAALQGNSCGCGCIASDGSHLGVGCSDPYGAGLNGIQDGLGPKYEVNPFTGVFGWPATGIGNTGNDVFKRLQAKISDLDPAQDGGGSYYFEAHYVTPDDALSFNHFNNVSWRAGSVSGSGSAWSGSLSGSTHREEPALFAWAAADPAVTITAIDVPGEGRLYLGWTVTSLGGGDWSWEFALYNMNSDRGAGGFRVALPAGTIVTGTGFHDVEYHSGEPFDGTDWPVTVAGDEVSWATTDFGVDPDANAIRWGTLYNFRFVADAGPADLSEAMVDLFKPGVPDTISVPLVPAPPANDDCADAIGAPLGVTAISNINATTDGPSEPAACIKGGDDQVHSDVWYTHTAPVDGNITVSLCGSTFDTKLAVYTASCPGGPGTAIACNDDFCDFQSEVTFPALIGQTFLIRIGASGSTEQGSGTMEITNDGIVGGGDHDLCAEALIIGDGAIQFDTTGATTDGPAHGTCQFDGQTYHDVWYRYVAPCDGTLTVSTCSQANYDTDLVVYDGCDCGNLVLLGCNDDGAGCDGYTSEVSVPVVNGGCYLVRVGGWNDGDQGTGTLTVTGPTCGGPTGPVNDDCADATPVGEGTYAYSNVDATTDGPDEAGNCEKFGYTHVESDVWFRYTAGCTGNATLSLCGSGYDTKLAVYDGTACPGAGTALACNDDTCGLQSEVNLPVTAGQDYFVRVGGYQGAQGGGSLAITCEGVKILDCNANGVDDAIDIAAGTSADCNSNDVPDECDIDVGTSADCGGGPLGSVFDGNTLWSSICFGCHGTDGSGGIGPDLRDYTRDRIWDELLPPTDHPGGAHPEYTQQDFANLEAFLDTTPGSGGRPDGVPDECQVLADCDDDTQADACELADGTQVDLDRDGIPDGCEPPCPADLNHDDVVDVNDLVAVIEAWGTASPDGDVNVDGIVDVNDLVAVIKAWGGCL